MEKNDKCVFFFWVDLQSSFRQEWGKKKIVWFVSSD